MTRYAESDGPNQGENRVTEATAVVVQQLPAVASLIAKTLSPQNCPSWVADAAKCSATVQTQVPVTGTGSRGFVDLALVFERSDMQAGDTFTLWVEVKTGSGVHGEQLSVYFDAADRLGIRASSDLVVLAPRSFGSERCRAGEELIDVLHWEDLAQELEKFRDDHGSMADIWLLNDYLDYLKREKLMEPRPIDDDGAQFMRVFPQVARTIPALFDSAADKIGVELAISPDGSLKRKLEDGGPWQNFSLENAWRSVDSEARGWFEFTLRSDAELREPHHSLAFFAGASWPKGAELPEENWFRVLRAHGFEHFKMDGYVRLMRAKYPDELLGAKSLEGQATIVADWVVETFGILSDHEPAQSASGSSIAHRPDR